jgi:predicted HicB family RNase H-like nuclease
MSADKYTTIRIKAETHPKLRLLAALTGESMIDLIDRLIQEETKRIKDKQ